MHELTRAERARLGELKAKSPYPPTVPTPTVRTEGEEIEFRRLTERVEHEERLAALRAQPKRSHDDLDEMLALGAPEAEVQDGHRKLAAEEAAAKAVEEAKAKAAPKVEPPQDPVRHAPDAPEARVVPAGAQTPRGR